MTLPSTFKRHAFGWVMLLWFVGSLGAHYALAMFNGSSVAEWGQEVFANWQSEAAQLAVQVIGLAYLLQVGAPSSKEGSERLEAKIDALIADTVRDGDDVIARIDREFMRSR